MPTQKFMVRLKDQHVEVPEGTSVGEVFSNSSLRQKGIIAALLNQGLVSLSALVQGECLLHPVRADEPLGRTVRRRTIAHMLQALMANRGSLRLVVGQSMGGGYFFEVEGGKTDLTALATDLSRGLEHLALAKLEFTYATVALDCARRLLTDSNGTKAALLDTWPAPTLVIVRLGEFVDIPHGPYAPDTSFGLGARVLPYENGLILDFQDDGNQPPIQRSQHLWQCYRQTAVWNKNMAVETVGQLNRVVLDGRENEVIRISEALHEKRIANIADEITARSVAFVCIAGPSSSGKTTFTGRLADHLRVNGVRAFRLSLDDYYRNREDCPKDEFGRYDFESPAAIQIDLIQEHFQQLLEGRQISVPRFDFQTGLSVPGDQKIELGPRDVVLVEGIHGNNPEITSAAPDSARYRIFVNGLNQLRIDDHNRILTSDTRLLRRIVRDRLYRGTSAADTIDQWSSVLAGEKKYIYPYQDHTDLMFNAALVYETAVLKTFAQRFLMEVPRDAQARVHAYRLLRFLELFVPVFPSDIPSNSILREFIGHRF